MRLRLGDKSIERDAARLRALLGPGGAVAGVSYPFAPVIRGFDVGIPVELNVTDGTASETTGLLLMTNGIVSTVFGFGYAPKADPSISAVFDANSNAATFIYAKLTLTYYRPGTTTLTTPASAYSQVAIVNSFPLHYIHKVLTVNLTGAQIGDIIRMAFFRNGPSASDTFSGTIQPLGFLIE
mgnify:FL=1